jgi:putative membrane protein insertion efficiency factor
VNVTLTERAAKVLRRALDRHKLRAEAVVRVQLREGAPDNLRFALGVEERPGADEEVCESCGVKLAVARADAAELDGLVIDYHDGLLRRGFEFRLPGGQSTGCCCGGACSCGAAGADGCGSHGQACFAQASQPNDARGTGRRSLPARFLIAGVRGYQLLLSPLLGGQCRFQPTCSRYFIDAVAAHGAIRGGWLGLRRIARCHPFARGGWDPVPPTDR